jgi:hypothetical protein
MQAQTAGTRRFGTNWLVGGALALAVTIAGSGVAATQLADTHLPWTADSAPAIEHTRPYVRPADRPADVFYQETSPKPDPFHRPTDNRTGHE